jgi:hypothetical protein
VPNGDLVLRKGRHELVEHQPQVYQETGGARRIVKGEYVLLPE